MYKVQNESGEVCAVECIDSNTHKHVSGRAFDPDGEDKALAEKGAFRSEKPKTTKKASTKSTAKKTKTASK